MTTKARVRAWLEEKLFLRIHMTLILTGTFVAGVVTTRMLMLSGVNNLALRYAIAVALAYLAFLVLVKLWLKYVGSGGIDAPDVAEVFDTGFTHSSPTTTPMPLRTSGKGGGKSSGSSFDLDLGGGDFDIVFVIVLIVVVVILGGFAIYFIYTAPALLSEAAFEAVLAASIARRAKKAEGSGWIGVVWRATIWPFVIVFALSVFLGWFAQHRCPGAMKLRDAVNCNRSGIFPPP